MENKTIVSKFVNFPYEVEQLKVSNTSVSIRINLLTGKEGDFWVCLSPSLNVSGYGSSKKEARASFNENIAVFCEDLISLDTSLRNKILRELGWKQKKYLKKQFSKAFVDKDGILQNLESPEIISLETVA